MGRLGRHVHSFALRALAELRINVGSGDFPLEGFTNLDLYSESADLRQDFFEAHFEDVEEVRMSHFLEHLTWHRTAEALGHAASWLKPGGQLVVEVPDMETIMIVGTGNPAWVSWVYGIQGMGDNGETHLAGFTLYSLIEAMTRAGFAIGSTGMRRFISDHPARVGFPCIEVVGTKR